MKQPNWRVKVLGDHSYRSLFADQDGFQVHGTGDDFDLVCFTGGTDVDPDVYGAKRHPYTSDPDTGRDRFEVALYHHCIGRNIPMVGICRGAQLLTVLSGGRLFQHVNNHERSHEAVVQYPGEEGTETMIVTSSHHQMMDLSGHTNVRVLGWSKPLSSTYENGDGVLPKSLWPSRDIEIAYFPLTNALCHQPHPEWMDQAAPYRQFFFDTVVGLLEGNLNG